MMIPLVYDYITTNTRGKAKHRVRFGPFLYEHNIVYMRIRRVMMTAQVLER